MVGADGGGVAPLVGTALDSRTATGSDAGSGVGSDTDGGMGMDMGMMQPGALLPEILLLAGAVVCLLGGSFLPRQRQWKARIAALTALVAAAVAAAFDLAGEALSAFDGTFTVDTLTGGARLIIVAATGLVILLGTDELSGDPRESETYSLILLSALGAIVLAGANDLLILITGYLLASIPLYGLIGLGRTARSAEAAMKTYLIGALLGVGLMLGVAVLYGLTETTAYTDLPDRLATAPTGAVAFGTIAVLGGLMFKAGGVPGHFWVPDATQGSTTTAAAFLTTVPKIGAVIATYRLVALLPDTLEYPVLIALIATASMTLGNLAAFGQDDPCRLLGWSTVSQVGYALVPVAVAGHSDLAAPSMLLFLAAYAVTNTTAFAVIAACPNRRTLNDYRGLISTRPALAVALLIALLGLVGTPPTAIFVGKLTTASAAWDGGLAWLALAVLANSVASLYYYLRWIIPTFATSDSTRSDSTRSDIPGFDITGSDIAGPGTARALGQPETLAPAAQPDHSEHSDRSSHHTQHSSHQHLSQPDPSDHSGHDTAKAAQDAGSSTTDLEDAAAGNRPYPAGSVTSVSGTSTDMQPRGAHQHADAPSRSVSVVILIGATASIVIGILAGPVWDAFAGSVAGH